MQHEHHYTLAQAEAVRPWVTQRIGWMRDARARLVALGQRVSAALELVDAEAGGAYPGRDVARPLVELSRAIGELKAVDVVVRDLDRGLIDFPSIRDGEEVYLCWLVDEDRIAFWHPTDAGFAGRRRL